MAIPKYKVLLYYCCAHMCIYAWFDRASCAYSQDAHVVLPDFDESTALFAVFDGHGGQ